MDGVHETKALRQIGIWTIVGWIAEQSGWHAWPERKDDKCEKIACGHRPPSCFIKSRSSSRIDTNWAWLPNLSVLDKAVACDGVVKQPHEKRDRPRDVYEGVEPIDVFHDDGIAHEESLNGDFPKDMKVLFDCNDLEGMAAGHIDGSFDESQGCKGPTELIYL